MGIVKHMGAWLAQPYWFIVRDLYRVKTKREIKNLKTEGKQDWEWKQFFITSRFKNVNNRNEFLFSLSLDTNQTSHKRNTYKLETIYLTFSDYLCKRYRQRLHRAFALHFYSCDAMLREMVIKTCEAIEWIQPETNLYLRSPNHWSAFLLCRTNPPWRLSIFLLPQ